MSETEFYTLKHLCLLFRTNVCCPKKVTDMLKLQNNKKASNDLK